MTPQVRPTPDFQVGETIECKTTGNPFEILSITPEGHLQLKGRAGLMPKTAAQKPLTAEQKAQLAADSERSE